MDREVDVVILGAGTAGLSALAEVKKAGRSVFVIDPGPLGTTCARTGCMPSKAFIQVANDFHKRFKLEQEGITGGEGLSVNRRRVLEYVRSLRDRFVSGVVRELEENRDLLIRERGEFVEPGVVRAGKQVIKAKTIVIATGARPILLPGLPQPSSQVLTSDNLFEQEDLPSRIAVIGTGVIGAEIGQALSRLGVEVSAFNLAHSVSGLTDPVVQEVANAILASELSMTLGVAARVEKDGESLLIRCGNDTRSVDAVFVSVGRKPNLDHIGIENLGLPLDSRGLPVFDPTTMQVPGFPVFIAGDVNADRPLLHEAADEGRIAGYNSVRESVCFARRTRLSISFTSPSIALVGATFAELVGSNIAIGEVRFERQGRSIIKQENSGVLRVYADRANGRLLGAEMIAPAGEHLAQLLALALHRGLTVYDVLQMPFYHPVVEEGLRTALRDLSRAIGGVQPPSELAFCDSVPVAIG